MSVQFIEENGQRRYAVIPITEYERMVDDLEMLDDIRAYDAAKVANDEYFPMELVNRLTSGENSVRVFREYRGLTPEALAKASGLQPEIVYAAEADLRMVSERALVQIAEALRLELEDLTASEADNGA